MFPFTLQQLRILKALATEKSFTKAAQTVSLSQPSVSKQMKSLEKKLQRRLLHRDTRQLSLTEDGQRLLEYAERILAISEDCCRTFWESETTDRPQIRIATTPQLYHDVIWKVATFRAPQASFPEFQIRLSRSTVIPSLLQQNQVELGLVREASLTRDPPESWREALLEDELCWLVSTLMFPNLNPFQRSWFLAHPLFSHQPFPPFPWITLSVNPNSDCEIANWLGTTPLEGQGFRPSLQLTSRTAIHFAVSLGLGVAALPFSNLPTEGERKQMTIFRGDLDGMSHPILLLSRPDSVSKELFASLWREVRHPSGLL